jgi:hypothetical protein
VKSKRREMKSSDMMGSAKAVGLSARAAQQTPALCEDSASIAMNGNDFCQTSSWTEVQLDPPWLLPLCSPW